MWVCAIYTVMMSMRRTKCIFEESENTWDPHGSLGNVQE